MYRSDKQFMKNPATASARIYIGNIADTIVGGDLEEKFRVHGKILGLVLQRGFGFIQFENEIQSQNAIRAEHGSFFHGKRLVVQQAVEKSRGAKGPLNVPYNQSQQTPSYQPPPFQRPASPLSQPKLSQPLLQTQISPGKQEHPLQPLIKIDISSPFNANSNKPPENEANLNLCPETKLEGGGGGNTAAINTTAGEGGMVEQEGGRAHKRGRRGAKNPGRDWHCDFDRGPPLDSFKDREIPSSDIPHGREVPSGGLPPHGVPPLEMLSRDMPPHDMTPRDMPPRDIPPRDMPPRDIAPRDMPPRDIPPRDMPPRNIPTHDVPLYYGREDSYRPGFVPPPVLDRPERNDCEIIVVSKLLTEYAEYIEQRLKNVGLLVDLLYPNEDVPIGRVLANISSRGCLYAILVMPQNEEFRSLTLNILHGISQEHRNIPIEDALVLITRNFDAYMRGEKLSFIAPGSNAAALNDRHPEQIQILFNLLAENRQLSKAQYDRAIKYLQERRELQSQFEITEGGAEPDPEPESTSKQAELQSRIMNILNKSIEELPKPVEAPTSQPGATPLLKDPSVQKALDSLLSGEIFKSIAANL